MGSIHVALGQLPDVGVDGGREQQGLAGLGQLAEDPLDIRAEPDVEHPVGLIEDDVDDIAEIQRPALDMIEHAAGRADDEVDALLRRRICRSIGSPPNAPQTATGPPAASFCSSTTIC